MIYYGVDENGRVLQHYGVQGMRWGHHMYTHRNGELNAYGRKRFASGITGYDAEQQIRKAEKEAFDNNQRNYVNEALLTAKRDALKNKQKESGTQKYAKKINRLDVKIGKVRNKLRQGEDFLDKVVSANNAKGFKIKRVDEIKEAGAIDRGRTFLLGLAELPLAVFGVGYVYENTVPVKTKKAIVTNKDSADPLAARRKYAPLGFNPYNARVDYKVKKRLEKQKKNYNSSTNT